MEVNWLNRQNNRKTVKEDRANLHFQSDHFATQWLLHTAAKSEVICRSIPYVSKSGITKFSSNEPSFSHELKFHKAFGYVS